MVWRSAVVSCVLLCAATPLHSQAQIHERFVRLEAGRSENPPCGEHRRTAVFRGDAGVALQLGNRHACRVGISLGTHGGKRGPHLIFAGIETRWRSRPPLAPNQRLRI